MTTHRLTAAHAKILRALADHGPQNEAALFERLEPTEGTSGPDWQRIRASVNTKRPSLVRLLSGNLTTLRIEGFVRRNDQGAWCVVPAGEAWLASTTSKDGG